jgi:acetyl-CoA C-acetyltransferase
LDAGAAGLVITKRSTAEARGFKILGIIETVASVAGNPDKIAEVPASAIKKALSLSGLTLDQLDLLEINEAFAAMPLVSTRILSNGDDATWQQLKDKTNPNGGAIAIGHPVGASGARILMTAMYELRRRGGGTAAVAICGGLAQGDAAIVRVDETCL